MLGFQAHIVCCCYLLVFDYSHLPNIIIYTINLLKKLEWFDSSSTFYNYRLWEKVTHTGSINEYRRYSIKQRTLFHILVCFLFISKANFYLYQNCAKFFITSFINYESENNTKCHVYFTQCSRKLWTSKLFSFSLFIILNK